jgi:phage-related protein
MCRVRHIPELEYISLIKDNRVRPQAVSCETPLYWLGSSKRDLLSMPDAVIRHVGTALSVAQHGGKHPDAKPWKGLGPGVLEVVCRFRTDTFRAVYAVRFERALYVLHCFQKKSPRARKTARTDIEMIARRLKAAQLDFEVCHGQESSQAQAGSGEYR